MKEKIKHGFYLLVLLAELSNMSFAQTQDTNQPDPNRVVENQKLVVDKNVNQRLQSDFQSRNPSLPANQNITWYQTGNGYYGTYDVAKINYIIRYDKKGNYIETFTKKDWDDNTNPQLKTALEQSPYKQSKITGYWESSNPNQKGYYLELVDNKGKSRVWVNNKNQFSPTPFSSITTDENKTNK